MMLVLRLFLLVRQDSNIAVSFLEFDLLLIGVQ